MAFYGCVFFLTHQSNMQEQYERKKSLRWVTVYERGREHFEYFIFSNTIFPLPSLHLFPPLRREERTQAAMFHVRTDKNSTRPGTSLTGSMYKHSLGESTLAFSRFFHTFPIISSSCHVQFPLEIFNSKTAWNCTGTIFNGVYRHVCVCVCATLLVCIVMMITTGSTQPTKPTRLFLQNFFSFSLIYSY